jgi:hypothetical protein
LRRPALSAHARAWTHEGTRDAAWVFPNDAYLAAAAAGGVRPDGGSRKQFFFEKKNQKTFFCLVAGCG